MVTFVADLEISSNKKSEKKFSKNFVKKEKVTTFAGPKRRYIGEGMKG